MLTLTAAAAPGQSSAEATAVAQPSQSTRRICAMCGTSLNQLQKRQGSRYCGPVCKDQAKYQRKKKQALHKTVKHVG